MGINKNSLKNEFINLKSNQGYVKNIIEKISFYSNKEAKELLIDLINFTKENNLYDSYPWVLYNLGRIYLSEDKFKNTDLLLNEAYNIFYEKNNKKGMIAVISGFIGSKCMQYEYIDAIQLGLKGISLAEECSDIERLIAIKSNIGSIYFQIEEFKKALEIFDQIEEVPWIGNSGNKVGYYINRAMCENKIKNYDKALKHLEYVKELAKSMPNYYIKWILELGRIYIKQGYYNEAEEKLYEAIKCCNEIEAYECMDEAIIALSEIDIIRGNYETAIDKLKSIEDNVEESKIRSCMKDTYNNFNFAYKGLKDYENAYKYLEKYNELEKEVSEIQNAAVIAVLDNKKEELKDKDYKVLYNQNKLLYKVGQSIISNLNKAGIFKVIAEEINNILKYDTIQIVVYNEEKDRFEYQLVIEDKNIIKLNNINVYEDSFAYYSIKNKEDIIMNDVENEYHKYIEDFNKYLKKLNARTDWRSGKRTNSLMLVPMIVEDKVVGALCIQNYKKDTYDLSDLITLKILSAYIAIALENSFLYKKVKYNANYDSLTGIFNRRKAIEKINKLMGNLTENNEKFYIAMIDIDNFKKINDVYGHIVGDVVLCKVANTIRNSIGKKDIIGRYGGEEFIAVVKGDNNNFINTIEDIRKNVEALSVSIDNKNYINVTVSIGVTNLDINKENLEKNIALADKFLYKAKSTGKNKVVFLD